MKIQTKLKAIALNTFKEAVRNKIFYLLIAFGVFFAMSSKLVSLLTIGNEAKVLKDVGLASIHFFSVLIAVFTGINLVYKEIEKKTIYNILSKPISRSSFIIGKFIGLAFTLLVALVSMAVIFFFFLFISTGELDPGILIFFLLLYMELLIITAISLLFSSFSTPILSSIFTICIYLIGETLWTFNLFKEYLKTPVDKFAAHFLYYILPNLEKFNVKSAVVMKTGIGAFHVLNAVLYTAVYITAVLVLAILIFNKREFK